MIERKRPRLKDLIEKENNFVTPTIEDTKNDLEELKGIINVFNSMLNDKNSKPFSSKYTDLLENSPYCEVFKRAIIATTYERVKNIIEDNKSIFKTDFKVYTTSHSVIVYMENNGKSLNALVLDILNKIPELTSFIYDKDEINYDKEMAESSLINLDKIKEELELKLKKESDKLEELLLDKHNLIPSIPTLKTSVLGEAVEVNISPVERQQNIIDEIKKELSKNEDEIVSTSDERNKIVNLLKDLENINFDDFEVLNVLLTKSLGIVATKSCYVPVKKYEKDIVEYNEYDIGARGYTLKYIEKKFTPRKGIY